MDKKSIIDKIRALKKLESRAGTQGEAEAAAYAIAGIIDRYKLAVSELEEPESQEKSKIEHLDIGEDFKRLPSYKRVLLSVIARHCGVSVVTQTDEQGLKKRTLIGFSSDVEFTRHMYSWLVLEAADMSPKGHGKGYSQSWCLGFARGIAEQLRKAREALLETVPNAKCAAIVLDKSPAVTDFMNKLFPTIKTTSFYTRASDAFAYLDGKLQGESTHLGKRLEKSQCG
jgi:hypothetical protein